MGSVRASPRTNDASSRAPRERATVTSSSSATSRTLDLSSMPELAVAVTAIYCAVHVAKSPLPLSGKRIR